MEYTFTVYGMPIPQGSLRAFMPKGAKHPVLTADNKKLKPWRQQVSGTAVASIKTLVKRPFAVEVHVAFFFDRPASLARQVVHKTTKPDVDKLLRSILDALTGIAYEDDAQVIRASQEKLFGSPARTEIRVVVV